MGVEALHEHAADPDVDLLVLDTPPAARGLDFLSAPERMVTLLENDALRFFLRRDGFFGRALSEASRGGAALLRAADRVLGLGFLADLADFFRAFDGLYDGFKERSREAARLLTAGRFLVATTLDFSALATSADLAAGLVRRGAAPGLILNRVSPRLTGAPRLSGPLAALPALALAEMDVPTDDLPGALASALVELRRSEERREQVVEIAAQHGPRAFDRGRRVAVRVPERHARAHEAVQLLERRRGPERAPEIQRLRRREELDREDGLEEVDVLRELAGRDRAHRDVVLLPRRGRDRVHGRREGIRLRLGDERRRRDVNHHEARVQAARPA